ncbi:hypothetical protein BJ508DRAFT_333873 [Ascobolus immersus RN42]|uniref:Uncharacterized protein n=1 Tax=Ascobolus immersus RN42 TaxID=1160509 RepID=A0A3N4HI78_ASCIM|nr:hypothetical protein BJ508DRAFT_333873 [Ascobolus immersus RN42]
MGCVQSRPKAQKTPNSQPVAGSSDIASRPANVTSKGKGKAKEPNTVSSAPPAAQAKKGITSKSAKPAKSSAKAPAKGTAKPPTKAKDQPKATNKASKGNVGGASAASKTQPSLLELVSAPHDDATLTRSFNAVFRTALDHTVEFYTVAGWKTLDKQGKQRFLRYVPQAEKLLQNKALLKWVVMAFISSTIWDWADEGQLFQNFRVARGGVQGSSAGAGRSIIIIDREKMLRVLKTEAQRFREKKQADETAFNAGMATLLLPFTTKKQKARHQQSLASLVSSIMDMKILLETQPGKWGYRATRSYIPKNGIDNSRMEVAGGAITGKAVEGVCWPALEKGGAGAGGKAGEKGVVLAKMRVVVSP